VVSHLGALSAAERDRNCATLIGDYPIFKEAFENIVERKMTMELSMTIVLLAALAIGEFFTALVITAFVLVAEVLERLTVGRGRKAIKDLLNFLPRTMTVRRDGRVIEIPAERGEVGDSVIVRPGGQIPIDGIVLDGRSFVEQAAITGEAMPVEKFPGYGQSCDSRTLNWSQWRYYTNQRRNQQSLKSLHVRKTLTSQGFGLLRPILAPHL